VHVDSVVLPITAGRTASELFAATVHMKTPTVNNADIERVLAAGSHHSVREGRAVLHSLPIGYALDDNRGIRDPRGMVGQRLGVDMHVATTDVAAARNLTLLVERCHIGVEAMVAAPYVSGLSVLAEDEADLGAAVIDLGAGTTTIAVFSEGRFVHVGGFAVGGLHVTMDIARGLTTTIADAERLKTLFGAALSGPSDDRDMISLSSADADPRDPPRMIPRAQLVRIIRPRVEEILEMARDELAKSPFAADPRGRVILVGGASQMTGLSDLAMQILGRQVRIGRPLGIGGLTDATKGPAFAATAGLLVYPQFAYLEHCEPRKTRRLMTGTDGYFTRVGRWLRESF
jgi:cell division protein FtsA